MEIPAKITDREFVTITNINRITNIRFIIANIVLLVVIYLSIVMTIHNDIFIGVFTCGFFGVLVCAVIAFMSPDDGRDPPFCATFNIIYAIKSVMGFGKYKRYTELLQDAVNYNMIITLLTYHNEGGKLMYTDNKYYDACKIMIDYRSSLISQLYIDKANRYNGTNKIKKLNKILVIFIITPSFC